MEKYFSRVFIAFSILLNAIFGGKNNQTLSATQWDRKIAKKIHFVWLVDRIFWWEPNHCEDSWIKWKIINEAIDKYDGVADHYYSGRKKKKHRKK